MLELMCGSSTDDWFWIPSIPPSQFLLQCNVTCHKLCRPYICSVTARNNLLVSLIIQKQSIKLCVSVIVHTHTHIVLPTLTVEGAAGDGAALFDFGEGFLVCRRSVTYTRHGWKRMVLQSIEGYFSHWNRRTKTKVTIQMHAIPQCY